jgi:hypothetical protein
MQYIIPHLQAREGFQVHVIIWSLGEFGRKETKHKLGDGDDDDDDNNNNNNKFHFD